MGLSPSWRHSIFQMVKSRTSKELKRKQAFKTPNKIELIVCEGSSTEPAYFNALRKKLRLSAIHIDVVGLENRSEPIDVVQHAISKKKQGANKGVPYNKIWCVIDVEIPMPHKSLEEAIEKAKDKKLEVILSNPFFEYWFLLHFKKVTTAFEKGEELYSALKEVHPTYKKTRIGFDILYPLTDTAIKHSKEVLKEQHNEAEDLSDCNPSTHVHKIVEYLHTAQQ